jgi:predicted transcriptional regulator YdeE
MIEITDLPALSVIGLLVDAHWNELPNAVPAAWTQLFDSGLKPDTDLIHNGFVEVSISRELANYRELLGVVAGPNTLVQKRMVRLEIPANRYLSIVHDGPLRGITHGFELLYHRASELGLMATDFKLDFGYQPGLPAGRHQLYVGLAPLALPKMH